MAALGIVYAYLISLPSALHFLLDLGGSDVRALITTNEYISFLSAYLLGTAAIFQLPVILFFIDHIRPIPPGTLKKAQKPNLHTFKGKSYCTKCLRLAKMIWNAANPRVETPAQV
jgi:Sec-independent protein secretion pathway component TatC